MGNKHSLQKLETPEKACENKCGSPPVSPGGGGGIDEGGMAAYQQCITNCVSAPESVATSEPIHVMAQRNVGLPAPLHQFTWIHIIIFIIAAIIAYKFYYKNEYNGSHQDEYEYNYTGGIED